MGNLGMPEILIIVLVLLIFFGAKKIPELAQGLGKGIREFKRSISEPGDAVIGGTDASIPASRQIDSRNGPTPPAGGEPKRLSQ